MTDQKRTPFYLSQREPKDDSGYRIVRFLTPKAPFEPLNGGLYINEDRTATNKPINTETTSDRYNLFPYFASIKDQIHRIGVVGKSGSGKSVTIGLILDQLINNKPKPYPFESDEFQLDPFRGRIIIFSFVPEDEPLDKERRGLPPIRIDPSSDDMYKLKPDDFKDCIVVFDDMENSVKKKPKDFMLNLRGLMMEVSRHFKCDIISVSHNILAGFKNNIVKNEMTGVFFYPDYNQHHPTETFLKKYGGFTNSQINDMLHVQSRFVYINLVSPYYYIWEKGIQIISTRGA